METLTNIQGLITTAKAADITSLTQHQVAALARAGEIKSSKLGNSLLIDSLSLRLYDRDNCGNGRPLNQKTAFAALWLLSGLDVDWLSYHQMRRLKLMLGSADAKTFLWSIRNRSKTKHYRVGDSFHDGIAASLKLTGMSSALAQTLGLVDSGHVLEGYCKSEDLPQIEESFFLREGAQSNVAIHVCDFLPKAEEMPIAVVAADLAASADSREHECGLTKIEELIHDYQNA
jgi:hypothetical protein